MLKVSYKSICIRQETFATLPVLLRNDGRKRQVKVTEKGRKRQKFNRKRDCTEMSRFLRVNKNQLPIGISIVFPTQRQERKRVLWALAVCVLRLFSGASQNA